MKIQSVEIKNLRSIKHLNIDLHDFTAIVGDNGVGKSTILFALNIFFRETRTTSTSATSLSLEDFHRKDSTEPIEISVVFSDITDVESLALKDYVRSNLLKVTARASADENGKVSVTHHGERKGIVEFQEFFTAQSAADKTKVFDSLKAGSFPGLVIQGKASTETRTQALHAYETAHPERCTFISSEDQFYGFNGTGKLAPFIQWVYVPAVRDASEDDGDKKNSALGLLLDRTVKSAVDWSALDAIKQTALEGYGDAVGSQRPKLQQLSEGLTDALSRWGTGTTQLRVEFGSKNEDRVRVDPPTYELLSGSEDLLHSVSRLGHGMQRSFIMALLQMLASGGADNQPALILAIEEPELYQHPPQARHLAHMLATGNAGATQTIVTTHSPMFVSGASFDRVKMIRKADQSTIHSTCIDNLKPYIDGNRPLATLLMGRVCEIFFSRFVVLVEGLEDLAYIESVLALMGKQDEARRLGINLVPVGGKSSMVQAATICKELDIPYFAVFDRDLDPNLPDKGEDIDCARLRNILGVSVPDSISPSHEFGTRYAAWHRDIQNAVVEDLVDENNLIVDCLPNHLREWWHKGRTQKDSGTIAEAMNWVYGQSLKVKTLETVIASFILCATQRVAQGERSQVSGAVMMEEAPIKAV